MAALLIVMMLIIIIVVVGAILYTCYVWFKPAFQDPDRAPDPNQLRVSEVIYNQAREGASPKVIHCTVIFPESRREEVQTMQIARHTGIANAHSHNRHSGRHHRNTSDAASPIVGRNPALDNTLTRQESQGDETIYENKAYSSEAEDEYAA